MRDFKYYGSDKINLEDYIQEIKPDYVLVLYTGISGETKSHGKYDFF